jgi:hypothetical protein
MCLGRQMGFVVVREVIPGAQELPQVDIECQHGSDLADQKSSGRF